MNRTYRIGGLPRAVLLVGAGVCVAPLVAGAMFGNVEALVIGLALTPIAAFFVFMERHTRLIVTAEGIRNVSLGMTAFIPWTDVARYWATEDTHGVELRAPGTGRSAAPSQLPRTGR